MHKQIFVNLPCRNLPRSKAFFESLGYTFSPDFTKALAAGGWELVHMSGMPPAA